MGQFVGDNSKWAPKARDFFAPKPGTRYSPPAPSSQPGQARTQDLDLDRFFGRGSSLDDKKRR